MATPGDGGPANGSGATVQARGVLPSLTPARACQARAARVPRCSGCFGAQPVSLAREGSRASVGFGNSGVKLPLGASLLAVMGMSRGPQEVVWDQAWNSAPKSGVGHRLSRLNACIPSHVPRNLTTPPMVYHLRSLLVRAWLGGHRYGSCLPGLGAERGGCGLQVEQTWRGVDPGTNSCHKLSLRCPL